MANGILLLYNDINDNIYTYLYNMYIYVYDDDNEMNENKLKRVKSRKITEVHSY